MSEDQTNSTGTGTAEETSVDDSAENEQQNAGGNSSGNTDGLPAEGEEVTVTQEELNAIKAAHEADKAKLDEALAQIELLNREKLTEQEKAVLEAAENVRNELSPQVEQLKKTVEAYLEAEISEIPEDKRDLIPNLSLEAKLEWVKNAKSKGLFGSTKPNSSSAIPPGKTPSGNSNVDRDSLKPGTKEYDNYYESKYGIKPKHSYF